MEYSNSINTHAGKTIQEAQKRQAELKKTALEELISIVNGICKREGISYFAVGELLTMSETGEDTDPERMEYMIVMLREDYDIFMKRALESAEDSQMEVLPMYDENGRIERIHSGIRFFREKHTEAGYANVHLFLRIDPFELLPSSEEKRTKFGMWLSKNSRKLIADAMACTNARIDLKTKQQAMHLLHRGYTESSTVFYRTQCHHFAELTHPVYAGRVEHAIFKPQKINTIYPIGEIPFGNTSVMVPAVPEKFSLRPEQFSPERLFADRLKALEAFDTLCTREGLVYTAMGLLSSDTSHYGTIRESTRTVRWQIGLPRKDYDRAVKLLEEGKKSSQLKLIKHQTAYPQVHADNVAFTLASVYSEDPWARYLPIELYPLDDVSDTYEIYHDTISTAIRSYRRHRRMMQGETCLGYDPWQKDGDTWTKFDEMQQERREMERRAEKEAAGSSPRRVYTIYLNRPRTYEKCDIFPVVRRKVDGIEINGPVNPYVWHEEKDNAFTEQLTAQRTEILKIVDKICGDLKVPYFAIATLLVGAAIYNDYVPGANSKSFDLGILRKDYERLIAFFRKNGRDYGLQLNEFRDEKKKYPLQTKTVSWIGGEFSDVCIRLLPFDKVPEDFYLYRAFVDDMAQRNKNLKDLIFSHTYTGPVNHTFVRNPVTRELARQVSGLLPDPEAAVASVKKADYIFRADPIGEADKIRKQAQIFNDDDRTDTYARVELEQSKKIAGSELFPLRRMRFRDMMLSCPGDYSTWQPMLNKELERQVSCIQKADLILLRELDRVCQKLNIGYFVCGGTMLGYMRHNGFIPWDDDVDVAMLRKDYNRFLSEAGDVLKERFFLQTRESDPNIPYLFSKIRLDDTEYITEYNEDRDFHKGICLDIFPFDYLPDRPENCQEFIKEVISLSKAHNRIANKQFAYPEEEIEPRNEQEKAYIRKEKNELKKFWKKDLKKSQDAYLKAATRYNDVAEEEGLTIVASFVPGFTYIDLGDLLPYQRGVFSGVEVSVPKRPDVFLTMQYGDYMQLPPKHQQVAHRLVRWSTWDESWDDQ